MTLKLGELFAGYGGLGLAVEEVFGAELEWYAEFDKAPSKIMAHHWPNLTNYGDVTTMDWASVPHVDIISGGSPCQDLSLAGARKGMNDGTRSNLWESMREAIATIKPTYVVWENVRGALSATATSASDMGPREGFLGERGGHLRALGRVLGDLADLGYDCQWRGLRAANVGAPHGRFRVFVLATRRGAESAHTDHAGPEGQRDPQGTPPTQRHGHTGLGTNHPAADRDDLGGDRRRERSSEDRRGQPAHSSHALADAERQGQGDGRGLSIRGISAHADASTRDCERSAATEHTDSGGRGPGRKSGMGGSLGCGGEHSDDPTATQDSSPGDQNRTDWGDYAPAIRRWEDLRGTAPAPTELTAKGKHRLSARFAEWLMGVDPGWITDTPGISRNDQLKAAGNGVVPQQASAALRHMLNYERTTR